LRLRASRRRTQAINGVQHVLLKHNLQQECPTKGIQTKRAAAWLAQLSLPPIDRLELDHLLEQWQLCERQLKTLDQQIAALQPQHSQAVILATIPGAAAFSSLALASRVGDIHRFRGAGSLANYWGLTPACRNSGEATDRLGSITKQGSALARFVLGQLVLHMLRRDPHMRRRYKAIKQRRGSKIARVAIMRQLACIIWHMLEHQQPYCVGRPADRQQTTRRSLTASG
jgi:transposase